MPIDGAVPDRAAAVAGQLRYLLLGPVTVVSRDDHTIPVGGSQSSDTSTRMITAIAGRGYVW